MKIKKIGVVITAMVVVGVAGASYVIVSSQDNARRTELNDQTKKATRKTKQEKNDSESGSSRIHESVSKSSSYSVTSDFSAAGEMAESASEMSSVMTADSGVPITAEMIKEARTALENQGVSSGPFSDLDMAKIINIANEQGLDYKSAITVLYPHYFD
ncbi:hypothetical protein KQH86_10545 [Weissella confusa]|uniref:hypothetical protein n=1 Tax=Weissella confusa TaxID=1583 RepID=UPI001C107D24|nr:hypothetical protein [Weissella confusa]MBU5286498.1 hypothetical protein [Weissella confusa]MDY2530264.1 hypothetical protein [Weissella confusa]